MKLCNEAAGSAGAVTPRSLLFQEDAKASMLNSLPIISSRAARLGACFSLFTMASLSLQAAPSNAIFAYTNSGTEVTTLTLNNSVILTATARGWYRSDGSDNGASADNNYIAGVCGSSDECLGDDADYRNWFLFDLEGIQSQITSATLSLYVPSPDGYISPNPSLTYTTYDVETSPSTVAGSGGLPVYNDLGSGIVFGSVIATNASEGTSLLVDLNAAGLAWINEFRGGDWVIGGAVTERGSGEIPEPSTYILLGSALAGLAFLRRAKS